MNTTNAVKLSSTTSSSSSSSLALNDEFIPIAIGGACLVLGYVVGSGRWSLLGKTAKNLTRNYGELLLNAAIESFQKA